MKKVIFIFLVTALVIGMTGITVFAHGHGGSYRAVQQQPQYAVCTVDGCDVAGYHQHDGTWYCSQGAGRGDYAICTVDGCTLTGIHEHNGTYYYCANHNTAQGCGQRR